MKLFHTILSVLVMLAVGCTPSNRPDGLPPLYPTTVTITQNGSPLADVSVGLISAEPSEWVVSGLTDTSGKASIVTHGQFSGAPAGEYTVVLSKTENVFDGERSSEGELLRGSGITEIFSLISVDHTSTETSKFRMTVNKGNNAQTFEVGAPVRVHVSTIRPGE